jgi:hypothetical protein
LRLESIRQVSKWIQLFLLLKMVSSSTTNPMQ